jgi:hypothetical protein
MVTERFAILLGTTQLVQPVRFSHQFYPFDDTKMLIPAGDITHGGLSLNETPAWLEAKKVIEAESGYQIVQWHRDELSEEVCEP